MTPVNQFMLGNSDPILNPSVQTNNGIDEQLNMIEAQKQFLLEAKQRQQYALNQQGIIAQQNLQQPVQNQVSIWDTIDAEIAPLTDDQKSMLFNNQDYVNNYNDLQVLVQTELLNLVRSKIEASPNGKAILENQYKLVKMLKSKVVEITNKEMELFNAFKEASKKNPNLTYEDFLKK